jgi:hypothetical protein
MSDAATFVCKRCLQPHPIELQVVTRHPTRICRPCWGTQVAIGHRSGTDLSADVCLRCQENPRTKGWGICEPCKRKYRATHKAKAAEKVLTPRETPSSPPEMPGHVLVNRETLEAPPS